MSTTYDEKGNVNPKEMIVDLLDLPWEEATEQQIDVLTRDLPYAATMNALFWYTGSIGKPDFTVVAWERKDDGKKTLYIKIGLEVHGCSRGFR